MLRERLLAANEVAGDLADAERDIDVAIASLAKLNGTLPRVRRQVGLSAVVGQPVFERTAAALKVLVDCRGELVHAHHALAETRDRLGLRERAVGGLGDKDWDGQASAELFGELAPDPLEA